MSLGRSGGMKRVQFENNDRPLSERRSIRYLKNWGSKFYATFNPFQTYELTFKGSGDDEELLASHRPNFKIHKCEGSTLTGRSMVENPVEIGELSPDDHPNGSHPSGSSPL